MWLYFDIDAQVLRPVLRQPLGHQESLCRVLHDGLKFHLSRGAALQIVPPVHQPHQWPVPLGKIDKHTRTERKITWKWKKGGGDFVKITITIKCNVLSGVMKLGQLLLGAILHQSSLCFDAVCLQLVRLSNWDLKLECCPFDVSKIKSRIHIFFCVAAQDHHLTRSTNFRCVCVSFCVWACSLCTIFWRYFLPHRF